MDRAALVSDDSVHGLPPSYHTVQDYPEESSVTEHSGGCRNRRRSRNARGGAAVLEKGSGKGLSTSGGNDMLDTAHTMIMQSKDVKGDFKPEIESNSALCCKLADQNVQASEAPKQDYIHVRARRGQATDSHSLAERARREKISERMKILQDLVPGCNKVIGKASILDEIINYIQSLQCQVEFLSMKLEAIDSRINSANGGFPTKDFGMPTFSNAAAGSAFGPSRDYLQESASEWLHMQVGGGLDRAS